MTMPAPSAEITPEKPKWPAVDGFVETKKNNPLRLPRRALLMLINLVVLLELPLMLNLINHNRDYAFHVEAAWAISRGIEVDFPHRLYHYLTIAIQAFLPADNFKTAAVFATLIAYLVLAVVAATSFYRQIRGRHPWLAIALTLALMLTGPILLFDLTSGPFYLSFAYVQFTYHNPTSTLMRALALIVFLYGAAALLPPRVPWRHVIGGAVFTFLLSNAKPSYNLAFLPAAVLVIGYRAVRRLFVDYPMMLAILGMMLVMLAVQYLTTFNTGGASTGVGIQPFMFLTSRGFDVPQILGKHALSMAMPVAILVLYWREARQDPLLGLAWITFVFGSFFELFVVELGDRLTHGNFYWTGEVTLFILFFASIHFWVRAMGGRLNFKDTRPRVIWGLWALHLMGGLLWYGLHLTST